MAQVGILAVLAAVPFCEWTYEVTKTEVTSSDALGTSVPVVMSAVFSLRPLPCVSVITGFVSLMSPKECQKDRQPVTSGHGTWHIRCAGSDRLLAPTMQYGSAALQPAADTPWIGANVVVVVEASSCSFGQLVSNVESCKYKHMCYYYYYYYYYLLHRTVILETLTGSQPVKKFPAFYGTRRFITACRRARHLSIS